MMRMPPSALHAACHCVNPHCPRPYPQQWSDLQCRHCGTTLRLHDRYIPLQKVQAGHSVHLYLVYDPETGTEKMMRLLVAIAPKAIEIFDREVTILSTLHHRGLPKIEAPAYFAVEISQPSPSSLPCFVMEKVEGVSFEDVVTRYPQGCAEAWVMNWFRQTVLILQKLHGRRLLHRDLKLSSLVLRHGNQQVAIADLGFPKPLVLQESTQPLSGGYSPPEQVRGEAIGPTADFYALGRICIQLLTGRHPLTLENEMGELQWRQRVRVQPGFANLLDRLVQKDVRLRFSTATDILEELNRISGKVPTAPVTPRLTPPPRTPQLQPSPPQPSPLQPPQLSGNSSGSVGARSGGGRSAGRPYSGGIPSTGGRVKVRDARSATKSSPRPSNSSNGRMYANNPSSSQRQAQSSFTPKTQGRYREDPHPQNLMGRLEPETFKTRMTSAIAVTEQAQEWVTQICILLFRAIVYACLGGAIAAGIGFWVIYWSPFAPYFGAFFAHQLTSPHLPLVVRPAMIVFAFAGVGTTWGLTQTQNVETQQLLWRQRALGGITYAIAWLVWQLGSVGHDGASGIARCTAVVAIGMVMALGARGNVLIQAIVATLGTSLTFAMLMNLDLWQPGYLFYLLQTTQNFLPTQAVCEAAIVFFGLLAIVFSFWLGISYYVGLPLLRQIRMKAKS